MTKGTANKTFLLQWGPDISRSLFSILLTNDTHISRGMGVFHVFEIWPKFYFLKWLYRDMSRVYGILVSTLQAIGLAQPIET